MRRWVIRIGLGVAGAVVDRGVRDVVAMRASLPTLDGTQAAARPVRAGDDPARCARRGHHRGRERNRRPARTRLRACAGTLLRDGPDAPLGGGRVVGVVRRDRAGRRQGGALASHAGARAGTAGRDRGRPARAAAMPIRKASTPASMRCPRARGRISCCASIRSRGARKTRRWSAMRCTSTCRMRATRANLRCGSCNRTCRRPCMRCSRTTARVGMRR